MSLQMTSVIKTSNEFKKQKIYIEAQGLLANAYHNVDTLEGANMRDNFTIGVIKQQLKDAMQKFEESRGEKCAKK